MSSAGPDSVPSPWSWSISRTRSSSGRIRTRSSSSRLIGGDRNARATCRSYWTASGSIQRESVTEPPGFTKDLRVRM
jgi:hypothetical protein